MEPATAEFAIPKSGGSRSGLSTTDALLLLMAVIWGVNYSVVKVGAHVFPPLAFNALRIALAAVVLVALCRMRRLEWPSRPDVTRLLLLGVLGHCVYQIFFIEAISRTRAGSVAIVLASAPAWLAILGRMRGVERVTSRVMVGIGASILGIALITVSGASSGASESLLGDLLALAGCVCWAWYSVLLKPMTHHTSAIVISTVTMIGGAVPLAIVATPQLLRTPWASIPLAGWSALLYGSLLAIVLAYLFWYRGIRVLGPTRAAMYANLQPVIALAVAAVMIGEIPTVWQGVGAASIMTGLILTRG